MSLRTRLWCALLVILLSTHVHLCEAITLTIGSGYTEPTVNTDLAVDYATGVKLPAEAASTTDLSYTVVIKTASSSSRGIFFYSQFNNDASTIAMFGPAGHDFIDSYCAMDELQWYDWKLMNFGAMGQVHDTQWCFFPQYRANIMYIFPNGPAQAAGLAFHLNQYDLFPRTQLVLHEDPATTTGVGYASQQLLAQILPGMGVSNYKTGLTTTLANYDDYIATKPGIIYLYAGGDTDSTFNSYAQKIILDATLKALNTTIGFNSEVAHQFTELYRTFRFAFRDGALNPSSIAIASWLPGPDITEYTFVQDFTATGLGSSDGPTNLLSFAGWLAGSALMQALTKYMGPTIGDRDVFFTNLVEAQSMFMVSDFFMGSFGPSPSAATCSDIQGQQGGVCNCHQGGNHIWLMTGFSTSLTTLTYQTRPLPYTYGKGMCSNVLSTDARIPPPVPYSQVLTMPGTVHLVGFSPFGDTMTSTVCSQVHNGLTRASDVTLYWHHSMNMVRGYCLSTTAQSLTTDLSTHQSTYVTTSLMGVIPDDLIAATPPPSTLILDFIPQTTQLRIAKTNYIYLFPTLEQELFVLANYLSNVAPAGSDVCAVVKKSKWSPAIALFLTNMMATFGITVAGSVVQPTGALSGTIPAGCKYTFVVGFEESDVAYLGTYLQSNAAATLLVSFDDVTKLYATFKSVFASASPTVTNRLIFATNLPTLTGPTSVPSVPLGKSAALSTVAEFVQTLPAVAQTPASVRAFIVSMVYDRLTTGTRWGLPDVQGALYGNETVRAGGMTFGPFYTLWMGSIYNFGARDIAVWSYTRVVTPSTPLLRDPVTPSFAYISAVSSSLPQQLMAARVGVAHDDVDEGSDCVQMQAESSAPTGQQTVGPKPSPTPAVEGNSGFHLSDEHSKLLTSSSSSPKLMFVARALIVLIILMVVYIAVLLLVLCGAVSCVTRHARLWKCCQSSNRGMRDDAAKVRARVNKESRHDQDLQQDARDPSRAPHHDATVPLTFVFVEVDLWRALWGSNGELTSRVVRHYQRCLRQAIVRHQCYEMKTMEGMCIVACPSAASGVEVAREIVDNVRGLARRDAEAVAALYAAMGAGACAVPGLRLRVAVNSGRAATSLDVLGRSQWRGSGVDDAVRAAYIGGRHGLVVVTANTKRALADVGSEPEGLESIGRCTKLADCVSSELFVLRVAPGEECSGGAMCELQNTAVDFPLYMLGVNGAERTRAVRHATSQLEAHYADVCEAERVADLVWMSQRFGLPDLRPGCYESQHELYGALLASVSEHLASMLECRHGVWRSARMNVERGQWREKVPDFAPMPKRGQKAEGTVHGTQIHGEHHRHSHRRARDGFVPYRHFSYHTEDTEFREYPLDL